MKVKLNKKIYTTAIKNGTLKIGTLKSSNKKVTEDIELCLDEPFFKPENIRHGITIAGVDGKYADVKYFNIYNTDGNLLHTLVSTEDTPLISYDGTSIILTNSPFENQYLHNIEGHCLIRMPTIEVKELTNIPFVVTIPYGEKACIDIVITEEQSNIDAFENIPKFVIPSIPYYVELPNTDEFIKIADIGETSKMLVRENSVSNDTFESYCTELTTLGMVEKSKITLGDCKIAVFESFSQRVCVQFLSDGQKTILKVIEDSRTGEFNKLAFSNVGISTESASNLTNNSNGVYAMLYDNLSSPSYLYKPSSNKLRWGGAMGFVHKLNDGSFFIIDGGMGGNNSYTEKYESQAIILYEFLKTYADDPNNIRIAGWLLTHAHEDHVGVFCELNENAEYLQKIQIDKVIYSLPPKEILDAESENMQVLLNEFKTVLSNLRASGKTELIKAHMGQKFTFRNLTLTILSAPEDTIYSHSAPNSPNFSLSTLNNTCVVSHVNYQGKDIIYLADTVALEMNSTIIPLLANYIKSIPAIILQVAHHGYTDTDGYLLYSELMNIEFTIWPLCHEHFTGKNVDGTNFQQTSGTNYPSTFYLNKNAALQNFPAIYPKDNLSVVFSENSSGTGINWDEPEYIDFVL